MQYVIQLLIIGISVGMIYALLALGISMIYSGLDIVHFAHGELYMLGGFFGIIGFISFGLPFFAALAFSMVAIGVLGILIERVFYRKLMRSGGGYTVAGMGMIICGFGMSITLQNVAVLIFGAQPRPLRVDFGPPIFFEGIALPRTYLWIVATAVVLMLTLHIFLHYTRWGRAVRAVAHSKDTSALMGINVPLVISLVFGLGAALAAAGGVLTAPITFVQVQSSFTVLMKAFAAAVIGGFGSLPGAIAGGIIVGIVESLGSAFISGSYRDVYSFVFMIAILMIRPAGLFGRQVAMKA